MSRLREAASLLGIPLVCVETAATDQKRLHSRSVELLEFQFHMARTKSLAPKNSPDTDRDDTPVLTGTLRFMRVLWLLNHALSQRSKLMRMELGITGPQRLVLRVIGRHPGISPGAIAKTLHVDKSTLTGVLQRLERRGLIKRRADPGDGRRAILALIRRGQVLNASPADTAEARARRALRRVPVAQRRVVERVLLALAHELSSESSPAS
jgi:MarR family transcriptional regulator, organic hydroperoxide resistance regulator